MLWSKTVHYYGTKMWLGVIAPEDIDESWSENVAAACNMVDIDGITDPCNFTSKYAQSWHFNTNDSCGNDIKDSRIYHAVQQLKVALDAAQHGLLIEKCYKELGRGLHPLQDSFAHSDEFVTKASDGIFFEYYTHATKRGWHADYIYEHDNDDENGKIKSVAETKTSPIKDDVDEKAKKKYNGRFALSRLATWVYVGVWAYAVYNKWGNPQALAIANKALERIGKDFSKWYAAGQSKNALFYLKGFIDFVSNDENCLHLGLAKFLNLELNVMIQDTPVTVK